MRSIWVGKARYKACVSQHEGEAGETTAESAHCASYLEGNL